MSAEGLALLWLLRAPTDCEVFEVYLEEVLAPSLRRERHEQIVVTDNLSAHKGERVRELVESKGCELLLYLCRPTRPT